MAYMQSDGSTRCTAIVRLSRGKTIVHQEARTFAHRVAQLPGPNTAKVVLEDPSALTPEVSGAAFTRACHVLGIKDLRFHDLRHEASMVRSGQARHRLSPPAVKGAIP